MNIRVNTKYKTQWNTAALFLLEKITVRFWLVPPPSAAAPEFFVLCVRFAMLFQWWWTCECEYENSVFWHAVYDGRYACMPHNSNESICTYWVLFSSQIESWPKPPKQRSLCKHKSWLSISSPLSFSLSLSCAYTQFFDLISYDLINVICFVHNLR